MTTFPEAEDKKGSTKLEQCEIWNVSSPNRTGDALSEVSKRYRCAVCGPTSTSTPYFHFHALLILPHFTYNSTPYLHFHASIYSHILTLPHRRKIAQLQHTDLHSDRTYQSKMHEVQSYLADVSVYFLDFDGTRLGRAGQSGEVWTHKVGHVVGYLWPASRSDWNTHTQWNKLTRNWEI